MGYPLLDLTNKTAVVIGGTSGIGLALTKALAQAGANVVPSGRRAEQLSAAVAEVKALGRRSLVQTCDVTDTSSLDSTSAGGDGGVRQRADPGQLRRPDQADPYARSAGIRMEWNPRNQPERNFTRLSGFWTAHDRARLRPHY